MPFSASKARFGDGLNSYFVEGLREAPTHPDSALANVLRSASSYVRIATNGQQVPQLVSDWTFDVVLDRTQAVKVRYIKLERQLRAPAQRCGD